MKWCNRGQRIFLVGLGWLLLASFVSADEFWVKNRPFAGYTEGTGTQLWAEAEALAKAMGLPYDASTGELTLPDGTKFTTKRSPKGHQLASVSELAQATGWLLRQNKDLGLLELFSSSVTSAPSSASWSQGESQATRTGQGRVITRQNPPFSVTIPADYEFQDKVLNSEQRRRNEPKVEGVTFHEDFEVGPPGQPDERLLVATFTIPEASEEEMGPEGEQIVLRNFIESATRNQARLEREPVLLDVQGRRFWKTNFRSSPTKGGVTFFHLNPKSKTAYVFFGKFRDPKFADAIESIVRSARFP